MTFMLRLFLLAAACALAFVANAATPALATGSEHTLALQRDGRVLAWGNDLFGELGSARSLRSAVPTAPVGLPAVRQMVGGGDFAAALAADGTVYAWGGNDDGQLGDGTSVRRALVRRVEGLAGIAALAAGYDHLAALTADGTVWAWGAAGQVGDGTTETRTRPVRIAGLPPVAALSSFYRHTLALAVDGSVWAWGNNFLGQLGDGTTTSRLKPVQDKVLTGIVAIAAGIYHSLAVDAGGRLWQWGSGETITTTPSPVAGIDNVAGIAAGYGFTLARTADGQVWTWGTNFLGQLGDPAVFGERAEPGPLADPQHTMALAVGDDHALALSTDGTVWGWGWNDLGQLGNGLVGVQRETALALAEAATGFADLDPDVANSIPDAKRPPFLAVAEKRGDISATSLALTIRGGGSAGTGAFSAGYRVFVVAGTADGSTPGTWWELQPTKQWAALAWPLTSFLDGVALDSAADHVLVDVIDSVGLSALIGTRVYLGYG